MKRIEFFTLQLEHLSHTDAAAFFTQTCDYAISARKCLDETANMALKSLLNNSSSYCEQVFRQRKNKFTELIIENRELSKNLLSKIYQAIDFESKSDKEENILAAQILDLFFISYSNLPGSTLKHQMEQTQEMILKYKADPTLKSAAKIVGIATMLTELEADNNLLIAVYKMSKNNNHRNRSKDDLRLETTDSYIQFCITIEQALNSTPNDSLVSLFNNINELIKKLNSLILMPHDNETVHCM